MKLSIITINYNDALGLKKTIESVVNQTFLDYEYIVIDGGSTDNSVDVIKQFEDEITYWISEPDKGIYNAMNKGILKANGEYLQFLNSGDWLVNSSVLTNMVPNLSDCDLVYGNMIRINSDGKEFCDKGNNGLDITFNTLFQGTINHSSAFIKRELFDKYGLYDEQLKIVSDWKFFLIAYGLNKSKIIYKDYDVNYFDMNGISTSQYNLGQSERKKVLNELVPYPILKDYVNVGANINQIYRLRKYNFTATLFKICKFILLKFVNFTDRISPKFNTKNS